MFAVQADSLHDYLDKMREKSIGELRISLSPMAPHNFYDITPRFGIYGPTYPQVNRLAYIGFSPYMMVAQAPENMRQALLKVTGADTIDTLLKTKSFYTQITFFGNIGNPPQTYNTTYHQFAQWITGLKEPSVNLLLGMFSPNGVASASSGGIPSGSLQSTNMQVHGGHWSPDNAKITMQRGRSFTSFWSCALSPDKNTILITYHLFANSNEATTALRNLLNKKIKHEEKGFFPTTKEGFLINNLCDLIPALNNFADSFPVADKGVINNTAGLIKSFLTYGQADTMANLTFDLCKLQFQLKGLSSSLIELK